MVNEKNGHNVAKMVNLISTEGVHVLYKDSPSVFVLSSSLHLTCLSLSVKVIVLSHDYT